MVSRGIATNEQLEAVSFEADFLFQRCIPFLDVEGRMQGQPGRVRALVCPLRAEMTTAIVARCLQELADVGLVVWYDTPDGRALYFPGFHRHNKVRRERESASKIPPPPGHVPAYAGSTPGVVREYAGSTPGKLPLEVEVEVEGNTTTATSADRAARVAEIVGEFGGPQQLGDAFLAVSEAIPARGGRDLLVEVLKRAETGDEHPAKYLRAMHNTLVPLGGKAATAEQLAVTLVDWLEKANEPTYRLFVGYLRRAHTAQVQQLALNVDPMQAATDPARLLPAAIRPGRPSQGRDTAGRDVAAAALSRDPQTVALVDAMYGNTFRRSA